MKALSIEYAHIYTSHEIGREHEESVKILRRLIDSRAVEQSQCSLVVLVDDYSFPDKNFSYNNFSQWLENSGFKPDVMLRESQLIPACNEVLQLLEDKKLKSQIVSYIQTKKKYPCSLFIAAWYLVRFGKIEITDFDKILCSKKLLNILPRSFQPFEEQGIRIIQATIYRDCVQNIEYEYIEGRELNEPAI